MGGIEITFSKRWKKCWNVAPDVYSLLRESRSLDSARKRIMTYLEAAEVDFRNDYFEVSNWDSILVRDAIAVLKNVFARTNEALTGTSPLKYLHEAAKNGDSDVEQGFIEEFEHLFRAIKGHSKVYPSHVMEGLVSPDFEKYSGRESAIKRSDFLDALSSRVKDYTSNYPTGLDEEVAAERDVTRKKILELMGGTEEDWTDYRWQYKNIIRNRKGLEILKKVVNISEEVEEAVVKSIDNGVPFAITPYYLHLMDKDQSIRDLAVRNQVFPPLSYVNNMSDHKKDRDTAFDFMREHDTSPVDHITRRYPQVAIFKPYDTCPQICVYCQRNWELTNPGEEDVVAESSTVDKAVRWIEKHPEIMDVLLTGGDPLYLDNKQLDSILGRLAAIDHLKSIRIASRTPVTAPQRLDQELADILGKYNQPGKRFIYFVTHFQHPYEISQETVDAVTRIRLKGINFYNQQVFTFANSKRFESVALRKSLKLIGIDPYYVFNMKGKTEMSDYAVPIARLLQERKEESRIMPGAYRTDEPVFNVPFLGKNHLRAGQDHELISIMPDGTRAYTFNPWEKNIRGVNSYIYHDVSISGYLKRLKEIGEDIEEYRSIWYYY